ncbi:MAG: hypothetical protein V1681_05695, partial [Candidatus Neomarinimicrobiota bacterium]
GAQAPTRLNEFPAVGQATTGINLFILSFDNYRADPEIDWLKEGFVDFLTDYFKNKPSINVQRTTEMEKTLEQIKKRPELKTARNFVLTGNYQRVNEQFEVDLQLTDINTWKTADRKKVTEKTTDLAKIIESVNQAAALLVDPNLIPAKSEKKEPVPVAIKDTTATTAILAEADLGQFRETVAATKQITFALDKLSNIYSSRINQPTPPKPAPQFEGFKADDFARKLNEPITQTASFQDIIYRIIRNPYKIEVTDPLFQRVPLNDDMVNVTFTIRYALSRELIQDMLGTLPYKSRIQNEQYVEYTFSGDKFVFQDDLLRTVARGDLRVYPVITFLTNTDEIAYTIIDIPVTFSKNIKPIPRVQYLAKYQSLINLTASSWNVKIQLNNADSEVEYSVELSLEQLTRINQIVVLFLSEEGILDYLKTVN